jgi:hypothetical protein
MWQHESMQSRKETRQKAWAVDGWAETVDKVRTKIKAFDLVINGEPSQTAKLAMTMDATILEALPWSPLK